MMAVERISRYFFFVFLFLLPFQTVYLLREPFVGGMKWEYGMIGVYAVDLLLGVFLIWALISWLWSIRYQVSSIKYGGTEILLILLVVWVGVSIFWAPDQMLALYFFVKLLLAVGLFFVARFSVRMDVKKFVFVLLAAGVIQSGIGVIQFLYQYSPASSILGISSHEAWQAGASVLKIDSGRFLRAYGTFPHPNILGGFLGVILVLGISYYVFCIQYERSWKCVAEIVATLSGVLIILLGLILTFSRTAWFGVLLGLVVIGFTTFKQKEYWIRRRFLKIVFALGMAGLVFGLVLHEEILPRFDVATIEREGSVSERITSLRDAQGIIKEHPFIGVGAGNFTAVVIKGDERGEIGLRPVWSIQPAHNVFLLIWSELGIVGLLLFVLFLFFILQSSIINRNSAILIAFLPTILLDHFIWSSHFGLLFFFLLLGLASRK